MINRNRGNDVRQGMQFCGQVFEEFESGVTRIVKTIIALAKKDVSASFSGKRRLGGMQFFFDKRVTGFPHQGFSAVVLDVVDECLAPDIDLNDRRRDLFQDRVGIFDDL